MKSLVLICLYFDILLILECLTYGHVVDLISIKFTLKRIRQYKIWIYQTIQSELIR